MGSSARAHLIYGFGWEADTAPPTWADEYGSFDYEKIDEDEFEAFTKYFPEFYLPDDYDKDYIGEWLDLLLKMKDPNKLLDHHWIGAADYSGDAVYVKRLSARAYNYEPTPVGEVIVLKPTEEELEALIVVAEYLGWDVNDIGWKMFPTYG